MLMLMGVILAVSVGVNIFFIICMMGDSTTSEIEAIVALHERADRMAKRDNINLAVASGVSKQIMDCFMHRPTYADYHVAQALALKEIERLQKELNYVL